MQRSFRTDLGTALVALIAAITATPSIAEERRSEGKLLVFTKAAGFVHKSIPVGAEAIRNLGKAHGFGVVGQFEI